MADGAPENPGPIPAVERDGIELGVPADEYHRRELHVASKSALDLVHRSPAHYLAWLNGLERASTPALAFGQALHMALLEPERFERTYAVAPDFGDLRFKENKARKQEWAAANAGKLALDAEDERAIMGMLAAVYRHPAASRLVLDGQPEVTLRWRDEITGLRCKSRADFWVPSKRLCVDLKSTDDASPDAFVRSVIKYRYHTQDAMYRAGFDACGQAITHFALLAVEKQPPHAVAVYTLDEDAVTKGFASMRQDMAVLADCVRRNEWPGYGDGVNELSLPRWAA